MSVSDPMTPRVIMLHEQPQPQQQQQDHHQQPSTARTFRAASRTTLQPAVQDFNGNIINKALDEAQVVWTLSSKAQSRFQPPAVSDLYAFPLPATFRAAASSPLPADLPSQGTHLHLHPHTPGRLPNVPALSRQDRTAAWSEEVHRRHVVRTARVRRCLSPKQKRAEKLGPAATRTGGGVGAAVGGAAGGQMSCDSDSTFSLNLQVSNGDGLHHIDDLRLTTTSLSRTSSRNESLVSVTARSSCRPATTGRYFDTSNGLRHLRSSTSGQLSRSRPVTATPWTGSGLKIKKVVLHPKELVTI